MIPLNDDERKGLVVALALGAIIGVVGETYGWSFYKAFVLTSAVAAATAAIVMRRL